MSKRRVAMVITLWIVMISLPSSRPDTGHRTFISVPGLGSFLRATNCWPIPAIFRPVAAACAQSATATLSGTVEDETGAVVPGANIAVTNVATVLKRETRTSDQGYFTLPLLPPGGYIVTVERQGFARAEVRNVVLNVGDEKSLRIQLKAGNVTETVQVTGEAPLLNESPAVGTLIDRQLVANIPLNGRTIQSLITLTPGVVLTHASGGNQGQFSVNGQRADANYFTVDGVSANIGHSAFQGQIGDTGGSIPGLTATGGTNNLVSVDAMQEFRIQTSGFAPEYGRTPGGQISIITRSGANQFHGSLFEYLRNDKLDANDWFANRSGLKKAQLRQNNFGGVVGGPIWRDHTFFFFSYEGQRLRLPNTLITSVPSLATRQAAPAAVQPFLNAFPRPNGPDQAGGLALFSGTYSNSSTFDAASLRLDHAFGSKVTVFARYNYAPSDFASRSTTVANRINPAEYTTDTATAGLTVLLTTRLSNDFRANWSRNKINSYFVDDTFGGAVPLNLASILPPFIPVGDGQFQFSLGSIQYVDGGIVKHRQRQLNFLDSLAWVAGEHQVKFGFDYRRLSAIYNPVRYSFNYFTSIAGALAGTSPTTASTLTQGPSNPIFQNLSLFAQDTWRISSRFQLTYGLRWELNPPPHEANGRDPFTVRNVNDPANMVLAPRGTDYYETKFTFFAPRIGASYALTQSGNWQTVLRGGFGIFYDLLSQDAGGGYAGYPFQAAVSVPNTTLPANLTTFPQPQLKADPTQPPYSGSILAYDPDASLPRVYQWNVAVEQQVGASQAVTVTYVGAAGRDLLRRFAYFGRNVIPSSPLNANFTSVVTLISNSGFSNYHALQVEFRRRLSAGLQGLASYTWGHSLDNASDNQTVMAPPARLDPNTDYAPSEFDIRHSFAAAFTYSIPAPHIGPATFLLRDWMLNGIFHARTAGPVNVILGTDNLALGSFASTVARPNVVPGIPLYLYGSQYPGGRIFNNTPNQGGPGCKGPFCAPAAGQQGTLGRNALRGFGASQLDFGIQRMFRLTENFNLQFRSEIFNIFNHPNFGDPQGNMTSGLFGQSTQMLGRSLGSATSGGGLNPLYQIGGPRSIQFALRLQF